MHFISITLLTTIPILSSKSWEGVALSNFPLPLNLIPINFQERRVNVGNFLVTAELIDFQKKGLKVRHFAYFSLMGRHAA